MLWLSLIHHLWGMSDNVGYFLIFFWYFGIPCAFESFLHVFPCKAVRGLAGLMPSQLAEMALLVLASVKRFIKRSESNETLSLSAMETNENQWNHFFLFNSFYSFLLDSLDEPVDRVKDPERSERPELLTHALRYVPPSACLIWAICVTIGLDGTARNRVAMIKDQGLIWYDNDWYGSFEWFVWLVR